MTSFSIIIMTTVAIVDNMCFEGWQQIEFASSRTLYYGDLNENLSFISRLDWARSSREHIMVFKSSKIYFLAIQFLIGPFVCLFIKLQVHLYSKRSNLSFESNWPNFSDGPIQVEPEGLSHTKNMADPLPQVLWVGEGCSSQDEGARNTTWLQH